MRYINEFFKMLRRATSMTFFDVWIRLYTRPQVPFTLHENGEIVNNVYTLNDQSFVSHKCCG